jgi:hypothetical protein
LQTNYPDGDIFTADIHLQTSEQTNYVMTSITGNPWASISLESKRLSDNEPISPSFWGWSNPLTSDIYRISYYETTFTSLEQFSVWLHGEIIPPWGGVRDTWLWMSATQNWEDRIGCLESTSPTPTPPPNQSPVINPFSNSTITLGDTYVESGYFTDTDSTFWTATVDYGDGSGVQPLSLTDTNFSLDHSYSTIGTFTVTVSVIDDQGATGTSTADVSVINTPGGSNVVVTPDSSTTVTFAYVASPGNTTLTSSSEGPTPPAGFSLGDPPSYYDINTTATYSQGVTVCLNYDPTQFSDPSLARLLHFENNAWIDVTTSNDTTSHIICGQASSLSPFLIAIKQFTFLGFNSPVSNFPTINKAKAGQAIPIKWSLIDINGSFVSTLGSAVSYGYGTLSSCDGTTTAIEEYMDTGSTSLRFDNISNQFILTSKTNAAWAGSCKMFTLKLSDDTIHQIIFKFTK